MKIIGVWIVIFMVVILGMIAIEKIDDLSSVIEGNSLWWHIPVILICGSATVKSIIAVFSKFFG